MLNLLLLLLLLLVVLLLVMLLLVMLLALLMFVLRLLVAIGEPRRRRRVLLPRLLANRGVTLGRVLLRLLLVVLHSAIVKLFFAGVFVRVLGVMVVLAMLLVVWPVLTSVISATRHFVPRKRRRVRTLVRHVSAGGVVVLRLLLPAALASRVVPLL